MIRKYLNTKLDPRERAKALLAELSLDEKMAQVGCIFPFGETYKDLDGISESTKFGIGQISTLEMRRMDSLEEVCAWQRRVQEIVMNNSPHRIPATFHMEGLCGAFIRGATSFPSGIARGASFDPELEREIGAVVGRQETACGITQTLAPVLDIARDPRMGRQGESYGEDASLVAAMGVAYAEGLHSAETAGRRTEGAAKHFFGFHASEGGIHGTHVDLPARTLEEVFAKPFQAAISEAGLRGIMPCYCSINGEPIAASYALLGDLLRGRMGFDGVIVGDYGAVNNTHIVHRIGETLAEAALRCMTAGLDVELPSVAGYGEGLKELFESGEADIEILDTAVLRILEAKFRTGLFDNPFAAESDALESAFYREGDRELTLRSALESIVLIKNNGALPLAANLKRIAVIGPHAADAAKFFGGYTHLSMEQSIYAVASSIAGVEGYEAYYEGVEFVPGTKIQSDETERLAKVLKNQQPDCESLLDRLRRGLPDTEVIYARGYEIAGGETSNFDAALEAVRSADAVILTLGGRYSTCSIASTGEGVDASVINLPACQDEFIRRAAALDKPLIGVHFDGRPISSDAADEHLDAILEAWSPAECGAEAVVSVLLGRYNPGGRMPVTTAYHAGQLPIYYNHPHGSAWHQGESIGFADYVDLPHTPRYPFGHGLSYTRFEYGDLRTDRAEISPGESVKIEFTVENVGQVEGDEVVQLYLCDEFASMTRPVKELAGFKRIRLRAGERKRVCFETAASQLAFLDESMRWKVEKGRVLVEVGASSEDIRLRGEYRISADAQIDGRHRAFFAAGKQPDQKKKCTETALTMPEIKSIV